ncbi:rhomboid protease GluP [Eubacterium ruminantium]|nr:rhomboid protease GluP [Eubacterium ruminantium]
MRDIRELKDKITDRNYPLMTAIFMVANILVFVLETIDGDSENLDTAMKFGAYFYDDVKQGEIYRLLTSCFVHFGFEHISSNMLGLFAIGPYVEKYFGRLKFTLIYIISGLSGSLLTYFMDVQKGDYAVCAGASGCIFGLFGILLVFALSRDMRYEFPLPRVLVGLVLMFIPSLTKNSGISLDAHLGGFVGGTLMGFIFYFWAERSARR